jgi:hypothetical protein
MLLLEMVAEDVVLVEVMVLVLAILVQLIRGHNFLAVQGVFLLQGLQALMAMLILVTGMTTKMVTVVVTMIVVVQPLVILVLLVITNLLVMKATVNAQLRSCTTPH